MSMTEYAANATLNAIFGKTSAFGALASAPTIFVGLRTNASTEATYTGYARVETSASDWAVAASRELANAALIEFGEAEDGPQVLTHYFLADAASGGNVLFEDELNAPLEVNALVTPRFPIGDLSTSLTAPA